MIVPMAADHAAATDLILYVATHPVLDAANIASIIASHRTLPAPGLLTALRRAEQTFRNLAGAFDGDDATIAANELENMRAAIRAASK